MPEKVAVCRACGQVYRGPGAISTARDCESFDRCDSED